MLPRSARFGFFLAVLLLHLFGCNRSPTDPDAARLAVYRKMEKNGYCPDSQFYSCTIQDGAITKVVEGRAVVAALKNVREVPPHSDPTGLKVRIERKDILRMVTTTITISPTGRGFVSFPNGSRIYFSGFGFYVFCQDRFDSSTAITNAKAAW
jgi:hypothetical protein